MPKIIVATTKGRRKSRVSCLAVGLIWTCLLAITPALSTIGGPRTGDIDQFTQNPHPAGPTVTIVSPQGQFFGPVAPAFEVVVTGFCVSGSSISCTVSGEEFPMSSAGDDHYVLLSSAAGSLGHTWSQFWATLSNGTPYQAIFKAWDWTGWSSEVASFSVDNVFDRVIVKTPLTGQAFSEFNPIPSFSVNISDAHLGTPSPQLSFIGYPQTFALAQATGSLYNLSEGFGDWADFKTFWYALDNATYSVQVSVTDSLGNTGLSPVIVVEKAYATPAIQISSPIDGESFQSTAPSYDVMIHAHPNLQSFVYEMDGVEVIVPLGEAVIVDGKYYQFQGQLSQALWGAHSDESDPVDIEFVVVDSNGFSNRDAVSLIKDTQSPVVQISSPVSGSFHPAAAPIITVDITDDHVDRVRYRVGTSGFFIVNPALYQGIQNPSFSFSLDQATWDAQGQNLVNILLDVEDVTENSAWTSINIIRDTILPGLVIYSPVTAAKTYETSPNFDLSVSDGSPCAIYVSVDGGLNNYVLASPSGKIPSTLWEIQPYGDVALTFIIEDAAGNVVLDTVMVKKFDSTPQLTVLSPLEGVVWGRNPLSYALGASYGTGEDLTATVKYSFDAGTTMYSGSLSGSINPIAWSSVGNGTHTLTFFVQSTHGQDSSVSLIVLQDSSAPQVSITSPKQRENFSLSEPPVISVILSEANSPQLWYTVGGSETEYSLPLTILGGDVYSGSGRVDEDLWGSLTSSVLDLKIYVEDGFGNKNYTIVTILRDADASSGDGESDSDPVPNSPASIGWVFGILAIGIIAAIVSAWIFFMKKSRENSREKQSNLIKYRYK